MRILFCTQVSPSKEHGGSKVAVELAEEMASLGWNCTIMGPEEIKSALPGVSSLTPYQECLRQYLQRHSTKYDVVDYDHSYLPYLRSEFCQKVLFVARSVILAHHAHLTPIPQTPKLLSRIKRITYKKRRQLQAQVWLDRALCTVQQADLINVCNYDEKLSLESLGVPAYKIIVLPFGISYSRRISFDAVSSVPPTYPTVAFVGTFDYRKGALEFPRLADMISDKVPDVRFRLLGTKGLYTTKEQVLADFPKRLTNRIQVVPTFTSSELPDLLAPCSAGVFPSHIEGFGFGVLEMLASSIPVVAYDVPGPRMMLPPEYLVKRGDADAMAEQIVHLLTVPGKLTSARLQAKQLSQKFDWRDISKATDSAYRNAILCRGSQGAVADRQIFSRL